MPEHVACLDTSVLVKALVAEEPKEEADAAAELLLRVLCEGQVVAPAWAWAEVGSVLRKKVRQGLLTQEEAEALWSSFCTLPIAFLDSPEIRARSWEIAERYGLPTLYDAAFLACIEATPTQPGFVCEYWTADAQLLRLIGPDRPAFVRGLAERQ